MYDPCIMLSVFEIALNILLNFVNTNLPQIMQYSNFKEKQTNKFYYE